MNGPSRREQLLAILTIFAMMASPVGAIFEPQPGPFPREGECDTDDPFFDGVRHLLGPDNNIGPGSLKTIPVPEPSNLDEFVRDRDAAIVLGKALFWDMQVGSDGIQACATCHFRAGVDPRSKNQLSPGGANDATGVVDLRGVNTQLTADDFPLHVFADSTDRTSAVLRSTDDVVSSQGVFLEEFKKAKRGKKKDKGTRIDDPVFNVDGDNVRRVEPRNTPTMINAVFNHRNFWDGRADAIFNGVNPFGVRDPDARVLRADGPGAPEFVQVRIDNASLASQAVGPPTSDFEMSFRGRPFQEVSKRLISARPLRQQRIHPEDSVFAGMIRNNGKGLDTTYGDLVRQAFEPVWWDSDYAVVFDADGNPSLIDPPNGQLANDEFAMIEYNFTLFFGLAVQLYEATLVSDDARIDQHFDSLAAGGPGLLTEFELFGMELFEAAACADCHSGPEFTSASVRTAATGFENPEVIPSFQPPEQIERMVLSNCDIAVYDQGFYNIGVRPFGEDLGMGNLDPFGNPLSIAILKTLDPADIPSQELLDIVYPQFADANPGFPGVVVGERSVAAGAFKIPSLRNVSLTAPYFHNGGALTLRQVVEFYNRGGDFHDFVDENGVAQEGFLDLGIGALELTDTEIDAIVAFLETMTDQRVIDQSAPFDHPELFVPNGHEGDENEVEAEDGVAEDDLLRIPEVGRFGGPLPTGFLEDINGDDDDDDSDDDDSDDDDSDGDD